MLWTGNMKQEVAAGEFYELSLDKYEYSSFIGDENLPCLTLHTFNDGSGVPTEVSFYVEEGSTWNAMVYSNEASFVFFRYDTAISSWTLLTSSTVANRTLTITGGSDSTNSDLIAWLKANATKQEN